MTYLTSEYVVAERLRREYHADHGLTFVLDVWVTIPIDERAPGYDSDAFYDLNGEISDFLAGFKDHKITKVNVIVKE